jgi:thiol:disulfide interchange protein
MRKRLSYAYYGILLLLTATPASTMAQEALGYDPAADPFALVAEAQDAAESADKLVLVIAGGDWCIWCHYLDAFLTEHAAINAALKDTFVVVKAYLGDKNPNEAFFATLPEAAGYPHFWVLAADGSLLASQDTLPLEDGGKSYDAKAFERFIDEWRATR